MKKFMPTIIFCLFIFGLGLFYSNYNYNSAKSVAYTEIYSGMISFPVESYSKTLKCYKNDVNVFHSKKECIEFNPSLIHDISNVDFNKKSVIVAMVKWSEPLAGVTYEMKGISCLKDRLSVTFHKKSYMYISSYSDSQFNFIIICTIDKNTIPNKITPELIISE